MITSPETLALIKSGRKKEIIVAGTHKVGRCYAVRTSHNQRAQAHVTVIAVKGNKVRFVLGDYTDNPRLLKARPGGQEGDYTSNVLRAMRGEPEAVDAETLDNYCRVSHEKRANGHESARERLAKEVQQLRYRMATEGTATPRAAKLLRAVESELRCAMLRDGEKALGTSDLANPPKP